MRGNQTTDPLQREELVEVWTDGGQHYGGAVRASHGREYRSIRVIMMEDVSKVVSLERSLSKAEAGLCHVND
jgi:hypothetical protein